MLLYRVCYAIGRAVVQGVLPYGVCCVLWCVQVSVTPVHYFCCACGWLRTRYPLAVCHGATLPTAPLLLSAVCQVGHLFDHLSTHEGILTATELSEGLRQQPKLRALWRAIWPFPLWIPGTMLHTTAHQCTPMHTNINSFTALHSHCAFTAVLPGYDWLDNTLQNLLRHMSASSVSDIESKCAAAAAAGSAAWH